MPESSCQKLIAEIQQKVHDPIIRERRAAIERLSLHMQQNQCLLEGIQLLQTIAKDNDQYLILRDLAEEKLKPYRQLIDLKVQPGEERHIFRAVCPDGHVNYFDKRVVCRSKSIYLGPGKDELILECKYPGCRKTFTAVVDCGEYR
jgi:hypothetical protein